MSQKDDDAQFELALACRNSGRDSEARSILEQMLSQNPQPSAVYAVLGNIYWDQKSYLEAVDIFRKGTVIAPQNEVLSLGLFHSLWESDRKEEALAEIHRFLELCHCDDYVEILRELTESSGGSADDR